MAKAEGFKVVAVERHPEGHFVGRVKVGSDVLEVHAKYGSWMLDVGDEKGTMRSVYPAVAEELAGRARQIARREGRKLRMARRSARR